jgi:tetratricopeptide (TPR) repeat protein
MSMKNLLMAIMVLSFSQTFILQKALCNEPEKSVLQTVDEEYDRFRKQGDDLFKRGEYDKALKKYLACLEVPNYAKDTYALSKVSLCRKAVALRNDISKGRNDESVITKMEELLQINPDDSFIKETARDYWIRKGNEKFDIGALIDSKNAFEKAAGYRNDEQIKSLIKKCDEQIKLAESTKSIGNNGGIEFSKHSNGLVLKIGVGVVAIGAAIYALKLNSDWQSKLSLIESSKTSGTFSTYQTAYNDAKTFQDSKSLRNICVGIAGVATLVEAYLIIRKPKNQEPKISIKLSSESTGLALIYHF